jgi:hypothetical protein
MKTNKLLLAALLVTALPAPAAIISATNLNGNSYIDYSAEGLLALDINANNIAPLLFDVSFSATEIASGSVDFNAVINNFLTYGISELRLDFGSLSVNSGSVQSGFIPGPAGIWSVTQNGGQFLAGNGNAADEYYSLLVGDPYASGALSNWTINTGRLSANSTYALRIQAVPEPGQLALLVAGLGLLGVIRRRRQA